jgi:hypothetical protein
MRVAIYVVICFIFVQMGLALSYVDLSVCLDTCVPVSAGNSCLYTCSGHPIRILKTNTNTHTVSSVTFLGDAEQQATKASHTHTCRKEVWTHKDAQTH